MNKPLWGIHLRRFVIDATTRGDVPQHLDMCFRTFTQSLRTTF